MAEKSMKQGASTASSVAVPVLLAQAALDVALRPSDKLMLATGSTGLLSVAVPSEPWVTPVRRALAALAPDATVVEATEVRRDGTPRFDVAELAEQIAAGDQVLIVSHAPARCLPHEIRAAVDRTIAIEGVSVAVVRRLLQRVTGQRGRTLTEADLENLDFTDVVAAVRVGASASDAVARLRRARMRSTPIVLDTPHVDELVGYGEAADWARAAAADLRRVSAGEPITLESALICGPPGTGKTRLARSIAHSAGVPLVSASIASFFAGGDGGLGDVVQAMLRFFASAAKRSPCVVVLDEIDALPSRIGMTRRGHEWWSTAVNGLLTEIDRLLAHRPSVLLLAITNHPARLDPALTRPGRLDRRVDVGPPDEEGLAGVFRVVAGNRIPLSATDLTRMSVLARGATGARVDAWVRAAEGRARREGRAATATDLETEILPPSILSEGERRTVAIHEAGHAVLAHELGRRVDRIVLGVDSGVAGTTTVAAVRGYPTRHAIDDDLAIIFGGRAADCALGDGANGGAVADLTAATRLAAAARGALGLHDTLASLGDPDEMVEAMRRDPGLAEAVEADLRAAFDRARTIVMTRADDVRRLADRLMKRSILLGEEVEELLADHDEVEQTTVTSPTTDLLP